MIAAFGIVYKYEIYYIVVQTLDNGDHNIYATVYVCINIKAANCAININTVQSVFIRKYIYAVHINLHP